MGPGFEVADHGKPWSIDVQQQESNQTGGSCSGEVKGGGGRWGWSTVKAVLMYIGLNVYLLSVYDFGWNEGRPYGVNVYSV